MITPLERKETLSLDRVNILIEEINNGLNLNTNQSVNQIIRPTSIVDSAGVVVNPTINSNINFTDDNKVNVDNLGNSTMYFSIDDTKIDHDQLLNFVAGEHYPVIDEDDMASDSDVHIPTQQSVKAYVDSSGGGGSPGGSDTQLQYNNGGSFGGASALIYNDVNNRLGINLSDPACPLEIGVASGSGLILSDSDVSGAAARIRARLYISGIGSGLLYLYDNTPTNKILLYPGGTSFVDGIFAIGSTGTSVADGYRLYVYHNTNGGIYLKTGGDAKIEIDAAMAAGNYPVIYFRKYSGGTSNIYGSIYVSADTNHDMNIVVSKDNDLHVYTNSVVRLSINSAGLVIADNHDITVGTTNGTVIGTTTSEKLAFWAASPVVQPSAISDPSGVTTDEDIEARTAINSIIDLLQSIGLMGT